MKKSKRTASKPQNLTPSPPLAMTAPMSELIPCDADLVNRSWTQWQFGDWDGLTALDARTLEHHPDRAQVALLVAAGQAQRSNFAEARQLLRQALDWGVDRQLLGRLLMSGVYNSLGRAKAVMERRSEALEDFESSIRVGQPGGAVSLVARARAGLQLEQLRGDVAAPRALQAKEVPQPPEVGIVSYAEIDLLESDIPSQDLSDSQFDLTEEHQTTNILVIFSTPRCGSTYFCNLLHANDFCIPHEYFQLEQYLPTLARRWGCISNGILDKKNYIQSLCSKRTKKNGWLGVNLHSHHIKTFEDFKVHFPKNTTFYYIQLMRKDILEQAVSYEIAEQTGQWTSFFKKRKEPEYNFSAISAKVKSIKNGSFFIKKYIEENKLACLDIYYENLLADPDSVLLRAFLNIQRFDKKSLTEKQACQINIDWQQRFLSDLLLSL